jgi:hypothetical protein
MSHTNGTAGLHPGENQFAAPPHVLVLGYYDGPTEGVIQFGDGGPVFQFEMIDDDHVAGTRSYTFDPLPADALDRITAVVAPHIEPSWPVWFPVWKFRTHGDRLAVDAAVADVLAAAEESEWRVTTADPGFRLLLAERVPDVERV